MPDQPFPQLGKITKRIRQSRGLTLDDVSRATGLSKSTLSKVENEKTSLTYDNLVRLSRGLQVDIGDLFAASAPSGRAEFADRRTIGRKGQGRPMKTIGYGESYLCTDFTHKKLIPVLTHVKARTLQEFGPLSSHRGEEFAYIVEGTIEFHYEGYEPVVLDAGDYIYFDSSTRHAYLNAGSGMAVCLSVMSPPGPAHFRATHERQGALVSQVGSPFSGTPMVSRTPAPGPAPAAVQQIAGLIASAPLRQVAELLPHNSPTPLLALPRAAKQIGVSEILYKNEGRRCGLGVFKAIGAASAAYRALADKVEAQGGPRPTVRQLISGVHEQITSKVTLATAAAGAHCLSLAWAARLFRAGAVVCPCAGVDPVQLDAMRAQGAQVRTLSEAYDEAVRRSVQAAAAEGWTLINEADEAAQAGAGLDVLRSYTLIAQEIVKELAAAQPPTHVFVQAGGGSLAAALNAYFWEIWGDERPRFVVVEPAGAAGLFLSAKRNTLQEAPAPAASAMIELAVARPFQPAWEILKAGANDFLIVEDGAAEEALQRYAGERGELRSHPSLSGVAGLAALHVVASDPMMREVLELSPTSRVLLIGTDGAAGQRERQG